MRSSARFRRGCFAVSLFLFPLASETSASATTDSPPSPKPSADDASEVQVAASVGLSVLGAVDVGGQVGVKPARSSVYVGARYLHESQWRSDTSLGSSTADAFDLLAGEVGYTWRADVFTFRPQLGIGILRDGANYDGHSSSGLDVPHSWVLVPSFNVRVCMPDSRLFLAGEIVGIAALGAHVPIPLPSAHLGVGVTL
jgi:hypothetical protein